VALTQRQKTLLGKAHRRLTSLGIDGQKTLAAFRGFPTLRTERSEYEKQRLASDHPADFPILSSYPIFVDRFDDAGVASGHYFHQDLLVARDIYQRKPRKHVDIGSSIYGFVSHVATFRDIEVLDVRPLSNEVPGITFVQQNVMALDSTFHNYADSVSCLHALEHFGLGRYSDPVDYDGWRKGLTSLTAMLEPGGILYLSVPTGREQRVEFNAHRVFSLPYLRSVLEQNFQNEGLAFVTDSGSLLTDIDPFGEEADRSFDASYGCSIWTLRKKDTAPGSSE
jgi:hypothetical protein